MNQKCEQEGLTLLSDHKPFLEKITGVEAKLSLIPTTELTVTNIKERGLGLGDLLYEMQRLATKHPTLFDIWLINQKELIPKQDFEDVKRYHVLRELINSQYPIKFS